MRYLFAWLNVILGLWLIISPWVLGYTATTAAFYNALIVGVLVAVFALLGWAAHAGVWPFERRAATT